MNKIIPIDKETRIKIEPMNFLIQRRRISKGKEAWRTEGYYADLIYLAIDYLNSAPARAENAIRSIDELIKVILFAESNLINIILNPKNHESGKNGLREENASPREKSEQRRKE